MHPSSRPLRLLLLTGFGLAVALSLFFAVRLALGAFYWSDPAHRDQAVEGWMPLGYVARSWDVPRAAMQEIAGIDQVPSGRRSLEMIARDEGVPLKTLILRIETGISRYRETAHD
ncbi:hypothetical protein [Pararhodobacter marinus]|nr:hypothetical protein [Pararhodobacter marinus]